MTYWLAALTLLVFVFGAGVITIASDVHALQRTKLEVQSTHTLVWGIIYLTPSLKNDQ